jgi:hypothetical protein
MRKTYANTKMRRTSKPLSTKVNIACSIASEKIKDVTDRDHTIGAKRRGNSGYMRSGS